MKWSNQKTIMFQVGIIRACMNGEAPEAPVQVKTETKIESKKETVKSEEKKLEDKKSEDLKEEPAKKDSKAPEKVDNNSGNSEINWSNIINALRASGKVRLYTSLANTKVNQQGDLILEIIFPNGLTSFVKGILEESANRKDLIDILFKETGKEWHIKLVDGKQGTSKEVPRADSSAKDNLNIDINVIE